MLKYIAIQLKALFMLTVFAANFYSICHCPSVAVNPHSPSHRSHLQKGSCCSEAYCTGKNSTGYSKPCKNPCSENDGCCSTHAVKFSLLEKQTAGQIALHPLFAVAFTHHFIISPESLPSTAKPEGIIDNEWRYKHSPPDLQALYQRFLI